LKRYAGESTTKMYASTGAAMLPVLHRTASGESGSLASREWRHDSAGATLRARAVDLRSIAIDWTGGHAYLLGPNGPGVYADDPDHRAGRSLTVLPHGSGDYDFAISVGRIHASWPAKRSL
jgi:hypothetical protein